MLHIPASRLVICLGLTALAPAIVLASLHWIAPNPAITTAFVAYCAVWLASIGAVHSGLALTSNDAPHHIYRYLYAHMPALLAVTALLCPPDKALFLLFLGFLAALYIDRKTLAGWYITLRAITTAVLMLTLYAAYRAL